MSRQIEGKNFIYCTYQMGCLKLTYREHESPLRVIYRKGQLKGKSVQRCLSTDPLAADYIEWSAYSYVLGNPVRFIDPDGKSAKDPQKDPFNVNVDGRDLTKGMIIHDTVKNQITLADEVGASFEKAAEDDWWTTTYDNVDRRDKNRLQGLIRNHINNDFRNPSVFGLKSLTTFMSFRGSFDVSLVSAKLAGEAVLVGVTVVNTETGKNETITIEQMAELGITIPIEGAKIDAKVGEEDSKTEGSNTNSKYKTVGYIYQTNIVLIYQIDYYDDHSYNRDANSVEVPVETKAEIISTDLILQK